MSVLQVSPFKLSMFRQCPQKYKFHYLDRLASQFKIPRPYLTMGTHVHSALRDFFLVQPVKDRTLDLLHNLLRKHWKTNREGFETKEEEKKWGEKALKLLENFFHNQDITITPYKVEEMYEISLNSDLILMGKIDRLDDLGDGYLKIIDYKTGKQPPDSDEFLKDDLQLVAYVCIITKKLKKPIREAICLYLENNHVISLNPKPEILEDGLRRIREIVDSIQSEKQYEATPNPLCSFCDFITICPKRDQIENLGMLKINEEDLPF